MSEYVLVPVELAGHHHYPASAGECPNPECPQWGIREAVGTFDSIAESDAYRLKMHDPEAWMLVRVLLRDTDRDWCEEVTPRCDICGEPDGPGEPDWNGETGNHTSCEEAEVIEPTCGGMAPPDVCGRYYGGGRP